MTNTDLPGQYYLAAIKSEYVADSTSEYPADFVGIRTLRRVPNVMCGKPVFLTRGEFLLPVVLKTRIDTERSYFHRNTRARACER